MTTTPLPPGKLVEAWRKRARFFRRSAANINGSKCHDGVREKRISMAAAIDLCADELEAALHTMEPKA